QSRRDRCHPEEGPCSEASLYVCYKISNSFQRGLDIGQRIGERNTKVTRAVIAESGSRESGNARFVQQAVCKFLARETRAADIRKEIKRTKRLETTDPRNAVQAIDEYITASVKFLDHLLSHTLALEGEGFHRCQ